MMKDDNIILPEEQVTQPGEIVFGVCVGIHFHCLREASTWPRN